MKFFKRSRFTSWVIFAAVLAGAYFVNVEVQSYLGRMAVAGTGLHSVSLDDALKQARETDKLILVDISAIWCSTCRQLDNSVFANADVKRKINEKFIFTRLEYESEEGQSFLEKHNVSAFPTVWILNGNGDVVKRVGITFEPSEFINRIEL